MIIAPKSKFSYTIFNGKALHKKKTREMSKAHVDQISA